MEEAGDKPKKKEKSHPPKEVSPFTQKMVKDEFKKNFWKDLAEPGDLAYNHD